MSEAKKPKKEAREAAKEAEEVASATLEVEEATAGKEKLDRNNINQKRKSPEGAGTPEPKVKVARMGEAQAEEGEIVLEPWRALVARMR